LGRRRFLEKRNWKCAVKIYPLIAKGGGVFCWKLFTTHRKGNKGFLVIMRDEGKRKKKQVTSPQKKEGVARAGRHDRGYSGEKRRKGCGGGQDILRSSRKSREEVPDILVAREERDKKGMVSPTLLHKDS